MSKVSLIENFKTQFKAAPEFLVQSPGRINLIGEHTDYNNGWVLPAAINKYVQVAVSKRTDGCLKMYATEFSEQISIPMHAIEKHPLQWVNYVLGVVAQIQNHLTTINNVKESLAIEKAFNSGFNIAIQGNIPIGAGLSSSAAFGSAVIFSLNALYALGLSKMQMTLMVQASEHQFAGVQCGIMDMFASIHGQENKVMLLDCAHLAYTYYPLQLKEYRLLLFDTQIKHALASSEYNTRRLECEAGVQALQKIDPSIKSLRDASAAQVSTILNKDAFKITNKIYHRCSYVVAEIDRVQKAVVDLVNGDLPSFGQKMCETHQGLSQLYEVSCPELDFLVATVQNEKGVLGARMMGGGFGGCTINLVHEEQLPTIIAHTYKRYFNYTGKPLQHYEVAIVNGTAIC